MQIYVIRHGLSEGNAAGLIQGHADSPLSEVGKSQANLLGRYFKKEGIAPERIISSPLARALETSQIIARELDPEPSLITSDGLKEIDVGTLSGLSMEDAYAKYPSGWTKDINRWLDFSKADGEGFDEFYSRVEAAVSEKMDSWDDLLADRTFFFVSHAGVMRPLLKTLLNGRSDFMYFTFGNCCHVRIVYRPVRDNIRRVLSDLIKIEMVAKLMDEPDPGREVADSVGKRIG